MVGDELDEATRDRMRRRSEMLSKEMARMLQELEQAEEMKRIEQNGVTWSGLLSAALWTWKFWVIAILLLLLIVGLCCCFSKISPERFLPELGPAMGVGSAFDCWRPQEDDPVYRMLVILKPPRGHTFCLEPGTVENESRICVKLKCTCIAQQMVGPMLCFLHSPEEQLTKEQKPSLLHTLCTDSCLDVQKTACWFRDLVRENKASTPLLPSCYYSLAVLPSRRSCRVAIQRTCGRTTLVEMIFGVQLGNSDIFMSSQEREGILSPSTTWTLTCAQAEAKFLWLMFGQTPDDSLHSLLHLCTRMLAGRGFFTSALKTVVMHLLTTTPPATCGHRTPNKLWNRSEWVHAVVESLVTACQESNFLSKAFFPELGSAMGVGSAFDCWSPQEDDPVYRMLVILKPPRGHTFCLEPGTVENESRICVKCTCTAEQMVGPMLCFLYSPEEQLTEEQKPSLLHTLCTGSCLDVQKTACWFWDLVRENKASTPLLPSCYYSLAVLPSRRSCRAAIQGTCGRTKLVEMILGVQLGNSDIFMSSQEREGILRPSTMWTLTCARAEAKFLWLMFGRTPDDSLHSLLHLCTRMLAGRGFFTYALKTVVMHLLTTTPPSGWHRTYFLLRLDDIMRYLNRCLEEKCLDHFFFGNQKIPEEIVLPPFLETAKPFNLFQHLAQDPAAHERAMREFKELQHRLTAQLLL
ncbi:uncharacterized protein [Melopsittacus undulatus]|uniref:uncharacterized protein n=1 Tax=Melopsittacus undulatus TaxID=13146 RepID=UPI00146EFE40|nr:uncharacterized protein LOC115946265 [Melopsittacus undulatus]